MTHKKTTESVNNFENRNTKNESKTPFQVELDYKEKSKELVDLRTQYVRNYNRLSVTELDTLQKTVNKKREEVDSLYQSLTPMQRDSIKKVSLAENLLGFH